MVLPEIVTPKNRRQFLQHTACGLGSIALSQLLTDSTLATNRKGLTARRPHFKPRAKNVIFIFMSGAPSQYDLYLPKPEMRRLHQQPVPESFFRARKGVG